jgi:class 3 adenylate cyclase
MIGAIRKQTFVARVARLLGRDTRHRSDRFLNGAASANVRAGLLGSDGGGAPTSRTRMDKSNDNWEPERVERRLTAILAADVVGYSRLMGADEEGTLAGLKAIRRELVDPRIVEHRGRIVKTTGDGLLVEFASVVDAVRCAVDVQREMAARDADVPTDMRIEFRVGINSATSSSMGTTSLAMVSTSPLDLKPWRSPAAFASAAWCATRCATSLPSCSRTWEQQIKNIARPVRAHRIRIDAPAAAPPAPPPMLALPDKPSIAVLPFQNMSGDPGSVDDGRAERITGGQGYKMLGHRPPPASPCALPRSAVELGNPLGVGRGHRQDQGVWRASAGHDRKQRRRARPDHRPHPACSRIQ